MDLMITYITTARNMHNILFYRIVIVYVREQE